jgi:hypothetical protein
VAGGGATEDEYEIRLDTQNTPQILSPVEERHFWLDWKLDHAHVAQLQLGRGGKGGHGGHGSLSLNGEDEEVILKWPIPVTFAPTKISALTMPQANVEIRYGTLDSIYYWNCWPWIHTSIFIFD